MTVIVPADAIETSKVIKEAAKFYGPIYIRLSRAKTLVIHENENYEFKIGKGIVMRQGSDATIIACGIMVATALEAAEILAHEKINVRVVNLHTIKPLDKELIIACARETGAIITAEEHSIIGGLGGAVAETLIENYPVPMARIGVKDMFGESGKPEDLLVKYGLMASDIVQAVKAALARKK